MPSCLLPESIIHDLVYKGANHHEDPVILIWLISSRIDSIRASQHIVRYKMELIIIHATESVRDQRPSNKVLQFTDILGSGTFSALDDIKTDLITLCQ
jgi:hypothetical protein